MLRTTRGFIFIIAAILTLPVGCSLSTPVKADFDSPVPQDRLAALAKARRTSDPAAVGPLIKLLSSDDPLIRLAASDTLTRITGQDHGYDPASGDAQRREAIERWLAWHAENRDEPPGRQRL